MEMDDHIGEELKSLPAAVSRIRGAELITCHRSMVQVKIRFTEHKQLVVCVQFPQDYPSSALIVELKSKTIPGKLINGLVKVCDQEIQKHLGDHQVLILLRFVHSFVANNPFMVCSEELNHIKLELYREGDEIKVKQKAGVIHYKAWQGKYFMDFKLTVPDNYPVEHVILELKGSNFPHEYMQVFEGQAVEKLRQCVQPPLRWRPNDPPLLSDPPFEPKPSLQLVATYLIMDCTRKYPLEKCPLCSKVALPEDPKTIITDESNPEYVYRVYCGHLYHRSCLETYLKTPPFEDGKKCPKCGVRIFHDKWNVPPRLAEQRWAHEEARKREIDEVADFLGF